MDNQRLFLYGAFFFVAFLLWQAWEKEQAPTEPVASQESTGNAAAVADSGDSEIPDLPENTTTEARPAATPETSPQSVAEKVSSARRISVRTDVYDLQISTAGGDIVLAKLRNYPRDSKKDTEVITLLSDQGDRLFVTQSGLVAAGETPVPSHRSVFTAEQESYSLTPGADQLTVSLSWQEGDLAVEKRYRFTRGSYAIDVDYIVRNSGSAEWRGSSYLQLKKFHVPPERSFFDPSTFAYNGPAMYDGEYEKLDLDDIRERKISATTEGGWIAMLQHYFLAAVIPPQDTENRLYAAHLDDRTYRVGYVQPQQVVPANSQRIFNNTLYIGPKLQDQLAATAPKLELSVDYGMLTIIADPLFWLLENIHDMVGNWGWAIILLVVLIKVVFYKLSEASGKSMAKMRKLQPRMQALKERYGDDREKLNRAMMEMYQKEKINPAAGCLPILIQFPVFIALYWVLLESVELRQADFMLWVNDLSTPDPYYVLPVLMVLAVWGQQRMNPTPPDPIQQKLLMMMPIMMGFFAMVMPSGLVLYWVVNSVLTAAQQWQINRVIDKKGLRA